MLDITWLQLGERLSGYSTGTKTSSLGLESVVKVRPRLRLRWRDDLAEQGQIGERTLEITSLELGAEAVPVPSVPVASYAVSPADCVSWDRQQE